MVVGNGGGERGCGLWHVLAFIDCFPGAVVSVDEVLKFFGEGGGAFGWGGGSCCAFEGGWWVVVVVGSGGFGIELGADRGLFFGGAGSHGAFGRVLGSD